MTSLLSNVPTMPLAAWEWFQPPSSTGAQNVDNLFWGITLICIFFFVLIIGLMAWFMWEYRARPGYKAEHSPHHNNSLEVAWSVIPLLLVIGIFYYGTKYYFDSRQAPDNAYVIDVVAKKWAWSFKYPNGHIDAELHVPVGVPVKLVMSSQDVLHSLYIPAFRVKMDCVPGKYTELWFQATQATRDDNDDGIKTYVGEGEGAAYPEADYDLFCTEYCGTGHSSMLSKVVVHESLGDFEAWMADATNIRKKPPAVVGEEIYKGLGGCVQCHSNDGSARVNGGPSFKGYFGQEVAWSARGSTTIEKVVMDENYIRESILHPQAKIRQGYEKVLMPSYQGQLNDDQIYALIQYIKSLNDTPVADWLPVPGEEGEAEAEADAAEGGEAAEPAEETGETEADTQPPTADPEA